MRISRLKRIIMDLKLYRHLGCLCLLKKSNILLEKFLRNRSLSMFNSSLWCFQEVINTAVVYNVLGDIRYGLCKGWKNSVVLRKKISIEVKVVFFLLQWVLIPVRRYSNHTLPDFFLNFFCGVLLRETEEFGQRILPPTEERSDVCRGLR